MFLALPTLFAHRLRAAVPAVLLGTLVWAVVALGTPQSPSQPRVPGLESLAPDGSVLVMAAAGGLSAGDRMERLISLAAHSAPLRQIEVSTEAVVSSALDSDLVNGLQLSIERCSVRWRSAPGRAGLLCPGLATALVLPRPAVGRATLGDLVVRPVQPVHLRISLWLPQSAGSALQGQSSSLRHTFTGTALP